MARASRPGAASTGSSVPVYDSTIGQYVYTVTRYYRLDLVHTLIKYRIVIASTVANLSNANFQSANLEGASLYRIKAVAAFDLTDANLTGVQMPNGRIHP